MATSRPGRNRFLGAAQSFSQLAMRLVGVGQKAVEPIPKLAAFSFLHELMTFQTEPLAASGPNRLVTPRKISCFYSFVI